MAIDFTVADAVAHNLPQLAARGINVVIGTTGWQAHEPALRKVVSRAGIGVLAAANFSIGMNLFELIVEDAAKRFRFHSDFGCWIHEIHHIKKKDAPSGTALALKAGIESAGYAGNIDVVVDASGIGSRHAHGGLRRRLRNHRAQAHGARSRGVCARRTGGRIVAGRQARLVFDAGHVDEIKREPASTRQPADRQTAEEIANSEPRVANSE